MSIEEKLMSKGFVRPGEAPVSSGEQQQTPQAGNPVVEQPANVPPQTPPQETQQATPPTQMPQGSAVTPESNTPPEWNFDLQAFNKRFETSFENEDSFKEALGARSKISEYEQRLSELEPYKERYNGIKDRVGKTKEIFANETVQKLNELVKKFPDKDPSMVGKILDMNIDNIRSFEDKIDALVLKEKVDNGGNYDDAVVKSALLKQFGINPEDPQEDWPSDAKYNLEKAFGAASKEFREMQNVPVDDIINFDSYEQEEAQAIEERKNKWNAVSVHMTNEFKGISVDLGEGDTFEFTADDVFKGAIRQSLVDRGVSFNGDPNEERVRDAGKWMQDQFIALNFDKIAKALKNHIVEKMKDAQHAELHNETPPNTNEPPIPSTQIQDFGAMYRQKTSMNSDWRRIKA